MHFDHKPELAKLLMCAALAASAQLAQAADYGSPAPNDKLAPVRTQIAAKQWSGAIEELKRIGDVNSADWNSLMGYTLRKSATPDLTRPSASTTRRCASSRSTAARSSIQASCT